MRILILGGGFAGVEVLKAVQRKFKKSKSRHIEITLVSRDNFLLFMPMLAEVASGMIEIRHIVTPLRAFCVMTTHTNNNLPVKGIEQSRKLQELMT